MKLLSTIAILLLTCQTATLCAQQDTALIAHRTAKAKFAYKPFIVPAALITYGIATRNSAQLVQLDYDVRDFAAQHANFETPIDDYLQYTPAAAVFMLDWCGIKARHSFRDRFFVMGASVIMIGSAVYITKTSTKVLRPDGSTRNSFPSGHTATAFTGAHILFKEYRDVSVWIGIAGYAAATATGMMRITNCRHWMSDVITGAGVGIVSVELGYLLLPLFQNMFNAEAKHSIAIVPAIGGGNVGIGVNFTF